MNNIPLTEVIRIDDVPYLRTPYGLLPYSEFDEEMKETIQPDEYGMSQLDYIIIVEAYTSQDLVPTPTIHLTRYVLHSLRMEVGDDRFIEFLDRASYTTSKDGRAYIDNVKANLQ